MNSPAPVPVREVGLAARNAVKLGLSLVATWGVATLVRLYLPRHLGPATFGLYSFVESLTLTSFAFLSLGVDGYSLREVAQRPRHASDYFGGLVAVRFVLGALLAAGLVVTLARTGPAGAARLAAVFAVGYLLSSFAATLAAFLQANATVGRLAATNVAAKVVWGALMGAALALGAPLVWLAAVFAVSEASRLVLLYRENRRQLGLAFRVDWAATRAVLWAAMPYFATGVALNLNRLDVAVLGVLAGKEEVGWYGAAGNFSMLVFLMLPLMSSVLLPTLVRVRAQSEAGLWQILQRVAEGITVTCVPLALVVGLGADVWVRLAFGAAYVEAAPSLRVLAAQAFLTYVASLTALVLIVMGRRWTVTMASVVGVVATPLLALAFIPVCARLVGAGGAGAGAALGAVGSEAIVFGLQGAAIGLGKFGSRSLSVVGRCLLLGAGIVVLHVALAPLGAWRLVVDAAAYTALALLLRVLPLREVAALAREILRMWRQPTPTASP